MLREEIPDVRKMSKKGKRVIDGERAKNPQWRHSPSKNAARCSNGGSGEAALRHHNWLRRSALGRFVTAVDARSHHISEVFSTHPLAADRAVSRVYFEREAADHPTRFFIGSAAASSQPVWPAAALLSQC